jgi:hypothetical protein
VLTAFVSVTALATTPSWTATAGVNALVQERYVDCTA